MILVLVFLIIAVLAIVLLGRGKRKEDDTEDLLPFKAVYTGQRTEKAFLAEIELEDGLNDHDDEVPERWIPFSIFDESDIKERLDRADEHADDFLKIELHLPRWLADKKGLTKSPLTQEKRGDETPLTIDVFFIARSESGKAVFITTCEPDLCRDEDGGISIYETKKSTLGNRPGAIACWLPLREVVGLHGGVGAGDAFRATLPAWLAEQKGLLGA